MKLRYRIVSEYQNCYHIEHSYFGFFWTETEPRHIRGYRRSPVSYPTYMLAFDKIEELQDKCRRCT